MEKAKDMSNANTAGGKTLVKKQTLKKMPEGKALTGMLTPRNKPTGTRDIKSKLK